MNFQDYKNDKLDDLNYECVDEEIRPIIKGLNDLPFIATHYCCAGFGKVENKKKLHTKRDSSYLYLSYDIQSDHAKLFHSSICFGLDEFIIECSSVDKETQILNGVVEIIYRIATDRFIPKRYDRKSNALRLEKIKESWLVIDDVIKQFNPEYIKIGSFK